MIHVQAYEPNTINPYIQKALFFESEVNNPINIGLVSRELGT